MIYVMAHDEEYPLHEELGKLGIPYKMHVERSPKRHWIKFDRELTEEELKQLMAHEQVSDIIESSMNHMPVPDPEEAWK